MKPPVHDLEVMPIRFAWWDTPGSAYHRPATVRTGYPQIRSTGVHFASSPISISVSRTLAFSTLTPGRKKP